MFYAILGLAFLALVFLPQIWVRITISRHARNRPDFPGTGGELARHLLDSAGLGTVALEEVAQGDHYDPHAKAVRLTPANMHGKSVSAVAIAAHEVGHALQDAESYGPLRLRTRLAGVVNLIQKVGSGLMLAVPVVAVVTRAPHIVALEVAAALVVMSSGVVFHLVTLPVEFNASFSRALPMLKQGRYLGGADLKAARKVLKAAAFTYISVALASLLDVTRWLRVLR